LARLLLDTTVLIDVLRGRSAGARLHALRGTDEPPYVCAVNVEELWRGLRADELEAARRLIGACRIAPLGRREGEIAGAWRAAFAARGVTLTQADCLIAAAALGVAARLATGNPRHFPMNELPVEHWESGR
jgi:predicted nucleic acid-binding protein